MGYIGNLPSADSSVEAGAPMDYVPTMSASTVRMATTSSSPSPTVSVAQACPVSDETYTTTVDCNYYSTTENTTMVLPPPTYTYSSLVPAPMMEETFTTAVDYHVPFPYPPVTETSRTTTTTTVIPPPITTSITTIFPPPPPIQTTTYYYPPVLPAPLPIEVETFTTAVDYRAAYPVPLSCDTTTITTTAPILTSTYMPVSVPFYQAPTMYVEQVQQQQPRPQPTPMMPKRNPSRFSRMLGKSSK